MIEQYIPQRAPFIFVTHVLDASTNLVTTDFTISEDTLFVEDNRFTEPGLMENMAQTAAAGTGAKAREEGKEAPIGFIGAVKDFKCVQLPEVGDTIITKVEFLMQVANAHVVKARTLLKDTEIASAEFKIFLQ